MSRCGSWGGGDNKESFGCLVFLKPGLDLSPPWVLRHVALLWMNLSLAAEVFPAVVIWQLIARVGLLESQYGRAGFKKAGEDAERLAMHVEGIEARLKKAEAAEAGAREREAELQAWLESQIREQAELKAQVRGYWGDRFVALLLSPFVPPLLQLTLMLEAEAKAAAERAVADKAWMSRSDEQLASLAEKVGMKHMSYECPL